jgi:hypothetical protein
VDAQVVYMAMANRLINARTNLRDGFVGWRHSTIGTEGEQSIFVVFVRCIQTRSADHEN